ncbi:hypothetical protein D7Z54_29440 [Salibacterium salarium]|uniref:Uncharacterized protein n=1 Tax=Salibacterium salarium TaxID=284579 RepID=A0A428MUF3_9BACI|nr:hypothetical protein [Salibacterium salarium]RSL29758.1 hypothetical protein D7Z54_29440 [Salibacterium salarium]
MNYGSDMVNALFEKDALGSLPETYQVKENLLGGSSVVDGNGHAIVETMPHAAGGETVTLADGDTAHATENVYGGTTMDFTGTQNDIVGRPSIGGEENYYQNGEHVATSEPNLWGDGVNFTAPADGTVFQSSTDTFGNQQVDMDSSLVNGEAGAPAADLENTFSGVDAASSDISAVDLGSATDVMDAADGADLLGFL